jgi:hypothetical protein
MTACQKNLTENFSLVLQDTQTFAGWGPKEFPPRNGFCFVDLSIVRVSFAVVVVGRRQQSWWFILRGEWRGFCVMGAMGISSLQWGSRGENGGEGFELERPFLVLIRLPVHRALRRSQEVWGCCWLCCEVLGGQWGLACHCDAKVAMAIENYVIGIIKLDWRLNYYLHWDSAKGGRLGRGQILYGKYCSQPSPQERKPTSSPPETQTSSPKIQTQRTASRTSCNAKTKCVA